MRFEVVRNEENAVVTARPSHPHGLFVVTDRHGRYGTHVVDSMTIEHLDEWRIGQLEQGNEDVMTGQMKPVPERPGYQSFDYIIGSVQIEPVGLSGPLDLTVLEFGEFNPA